MHTDLQELLLQIAVVKAQAAHSYDQSAELIIEVQTTLRLLAAEERSQALRLRERVGWHQAPPALSPPADLVRPTWDSVLMLAFSLDQAAAAGLVGLTLAADLRLADFASQLVAAEPDHQRAALELLGLAADEESGRGRLLATEMVSIRDWIKEIFPRRERLAALAAAGMVHADAAVKHDAFLASLGDRIQEALGVLGE